MVKDSNLYVRFVGKTHYAALGLFGRTHHSAKYFAEKELCGRVPQAVVATCDRLLVGFFRFEKLDYLKSISAAGTWVHPAWRRAGLATAMWDRVLAKYPNHEVCVTTVSAAGDGLVHHLVSENPQRIDTV